MPHLMRHPGSIFGLLLKFTPYLIRGGNDNHSKGIHDAVHYPYFFVELLESKLEPLLRDRSPPSLAFAFLGEFEPNFLVKMTRRVETRESPEVDFAKLHLPAELDCLSKQPLPDSMALVFRRHNEPSQVGPAAIVMDSIDGNSARNLLPYTYYPKPIMRFVKAPQKLRKLYGHFRLEEKVKTPLFVIIRTMEFGNSTDGARNITRQRYIAHSHEENPLIYLKVN
jgi:hypothetical protein